MERNNNKPKYPDYFDLDKEHHPPSKYWDNLKHPVYTEIDNELNSLRKNATSITAAKNCEIYADIDWDKLNEEYTLATQNALVFTPYPLILANDNLYSVWDLRSYKFLNQSHIPSSVNPILWEHAKLNLNSGLFRVSDTIFQIRGFDFANMSIIKGKSGWIIVDCLTSEETAKAAISLLYKCFGPIPISTIIITHSTVDHYGGILGILNSYLTKDFKIYAPYGFNNSVQEKSINVGITMIRRGTYMYGDILSKDDKGHIDNDIGKCISTGLSTLSKDIIEITPINGENLIEMIIDGTPIKFHLSPKLPSEMNVYFPLDKALCLSEMCIFNSSSTFSFKGCNVNDPESCANYIQETINYFGHDLNLIFSVHTWPRCNNDYCIEYLKKQRDIYQYVNDQTLRLINKGYTYDNISKLIKFPKSLFNNWYDNKHFDALTHCCKIIFEKYMGWYDGNPVNINKLTSYESSKKYIEYMGGESCVLEKALKDYETGEYQWVAEITKHLIWANPENKKAKLLCADALEQLGYMAQSGICRNEYLMGSQELRFGTTKFIGNIIDSNILDALPLSKVLYLFSIRINGIEAENFDFKINFIISDRNETASTEIKHGLFRYLCNELDETASVTATMTKNSLYKLAITNDRPDNSNISIKGDITKWQLFLWSQDLLNPNFNIMTPVNN